MKVHPLAILFGTVVDLGFSFGISLLLPLFGIYGSNPYLLDLSLMLGLIAVAVGGYVTAWRSSSNKVFNAIIFAAIQILIGIFGTFVVPAPSWFTVLSSILIVPAALLGASIAKTHSKISSSV